MDVPGGPGPGTGRRAFAWPVLLLGGWWAMAQGRLTTGALAISLPFLLFWYGHVWTAMLAAFAAHFLLAWYRSGTGWRLSAFLLPLLLIVAAAASVALLRLLAGPGLPA